MKDSVYVIQIHAELNQLQIKYSGEECAHLIKMFHEVFTTLASLLYQIITNQRHGLETQSITDATDVKCFTLHPVTLL